MKDLMILWHSLSGNNYLHTANTNSDNEDNLGGQDNPRVSSFRRKSSVMVNRFLNITVPLHADGNQKRTRTIFILMTLGLLSITFGLLTLVIQPYDVLFKWKLQLGENGEIFKLWQKPEINIYLKIYLFNVTNRDEFLQGRESKLRLQEIGPYVYKELLEHANVVFNDNGTLTTIPFHPLQYVPEMSNGTEEDLVIMPNIALLSITNVMKDASYLTRWGLNTLIRQTDSYPLVKMTTREFMFGYKSTLVTLGNHVMPSWIKFDKLGLIDRMYDFDNTIETIYTGETDIRLSGLIEKYNGNVDLPQWTGKCANINGTSDGFKFSSSIQPNDTILFFRKSLCRSAQMVRNGEKTIKGLYSYRYTFKENEFDNGAINPENKCFCRQGVCLKPGFIDVTDCYYGFPIALSYPHFYKIDPSFLETVEGLEPKEELHKSYCYVEPKSGLPTNVAFRFQINMMLQNIGHMARVEKFANFVLPLLWFEIGMYEIPNVLNIRFLFYLVILPIIQDVMIYLFFLSGMVLLVWSIVKILAYQKKRSSLNWMEKEMSRKKQRVQNDKQTDQISREIDTYSSLLIPDDRNLTNNSVII